MLSHRLQHDVNWEWLEGTFSRRIVEWTHLMNVKANVIKMQKRLHLAACNLVLYISHTSCKYYIRSSALLYKLAGFKMEISRTTYWPEHYGLIPPWCTCNRGPLIFYNLQWASNQSIPPHACDFGDEFDRMWSRNLTQVMPISIQTQKCPRKGANKIRPRLASPPRWTWRMDWSTWSHS